MTPGDPTTTVVILGFASWSDRSFELIIQNREGVETTLKGTLAPGQLEVVDQILPTCVYVSARNIQMKPTMPDNPTAKLFPAQNYEPIFRELEGNTDV